MTDSPASEPDDPFAEIRPYSNLDAPEVLKRLSRDTELADTIALWRQNDAAFVFEIVAD